jgi:hypothetical protein
LDSQKPGRVGQKFPATDLHQEKPVRKNKPEEEKRYLVNEYSELSGN